MFKKKRGIQLSYNRQGLVYFTCMTLKDQPEAVKNRVVEICREVAGEDSEALMELLTNDRKSVLAVSMEHYLPEKKLYKYRKEFYERWYSATGTYS